MRQVILSVTERTRLIAGTRYDSPTNDGAAGTISPTTIVGEKSDSAHTFRLGLTHDFTQNITAYGSYAKSFNPVDAVDARPAKSSIRKPARVSRRA